MQCCFDWAGRSVTAWKVSKYRPEKTPYLGNFHTVYVAASASGHHYPHD